MSSELLKNGIIKSEILNNDSTFILCSYYWGMGKINKGSIKKLTYDQQVERMIEDCKKNKVNYYFVMYPQLEKIAYQDAIGLKPEFIKLCLDTFKQYKCVYVDTDMRIMHYPYLFDADADCWFMNWNEIDYNCYNPLQLELPGGIMAFANTSNSRILLDVLIKKLNVRYAEDKTFSGIITRHFLNTYARCIWLPVNYLYMFTEHEYVPMKGYTHIASYKEELKYADYKMKDLVFVHEDFETGALDDIYAQKVSKSRWPPNANRQFGEKLRCYKLKMDTFIDWGFNKKQIDQLQVDAKLRQKSGLIRIKTVPKESEFKFSKTKLYKSIEGESPFEIVSLINSDEINLVDKFVKRCEKYKLSCKIYKSDEMVNKALFLYKMLKMTTKKSIVYMNINSKLRFDPQIFYKDTMDFMLVNMNTHFKLSNCYDPRILKTLNDDIIYINKNNLMKQFLMIWAKYNTKKYVKSDRQNKSLEYAFNVSGALNRLRCYWLSKKYIKLYNKNKNKYEDLKKIRNLRRSMEQCGIKPARDSEMSYVYRYGSRGRRGINKYGKLFV